MQIQKENRLIPIQPEALACPSEHLAHSRVGFCAELCTLRRWFVLDANHEFGTGRLGG